jgi:hypothetical protein
LIDHQRNLAIYKIGWGLTEMRFLIPTASETEEGRFRF